MQKIDDERMRRWKEAQEEILNKKRQKEGEAVAAAVEAVIAAGNAQHELDGVPEYEDGGGDAVRGDRRRRLEEIPPAAATEEEAQDAKDDSRYGWHGYAAVWLSRYASRRYG